MENFLERKARQQVSPQNPQKIMVIKQQLLQNKTGNTDMQTVFIAFRLNFAIQLQCICLIKMQQLLTFLYTCPSKK